ncbi:uncharacterized protein YndB with AHSA1/START domain [Catenuloplanes nepalensis]|uniref:Uncharacterized protein YndB with AHSA1/START domain n=1 Tax=Catenuloplanes nepalensis TaxID=587533 RepID=A0ABT9MY38_9ACTN|nr:SRPBCC family protein [Catenuloplanes nepalensis]MDP9796156.1 uncharacterized protein YndB with AHSA1/START domain [Catenuloplanes nepalensis]
MSSYDVQAVSAAPPAAVFALVSDVTTWPSWQAISSARPDGDEWVLGGGPRTVIRVTEIVPDRSLSYIETSETLWRGYRATIEVTPDPGGGSRIRWHATFRSRPRFLDPFWAWANGRVIRHHADQLARLAAEGR